jgi:hypothetical protein
LYPALISKFTHSLILQATYSSLRTCHYGCHIFAEKAKTRGSNDVVDRQAAGRLRGCFQWPLHRLATDHAIYNYVPAILFVLTLISPLDCLLS